MDLSSVAHARHEYCSPIGSDTVRGIVSILDLPRGAHCVDYGCGKGRLLLDILSAYDGAAGRGYDANEGFILEARRRAAIAGLDGRASFEVKTVEAANVEPRCDLAICLGSMHIFGGLEKTADVLAGTLRPGGKVLLADGYWKRTPSRKFLQEFYDSAESDLSYMPQIIDAVRAAGLCAPYILTSSDREWEDYEALWSSTLETASYGVDDPQMVREMRERAQKSRDNYWIHGGREALGYAIVVAALRC